jgi:DNA-binding MarR family transcriptional regulator
MPRPNATAAARAKAASKPRVPADRARRPPCKEACSRSPYAIAVLQQFRELFRVSLQNFQRIEASCGVSGAQVWALSELASTPGLSVTGLAQRLSIHLSTSSNLLDKLEAQRLIRRERSSADQRVVHIHLTGEGRRLIGKVPRPAEGIIPDALARMSPQALRSLKRDLGRLLELASLRDARAAMKPLAEP